MKPQKLAAFSVRPRHLAVAIFDGLSLLHVRDIELRSSHDKATNSLREFVNRVIDEFNIESAGLYETPYDGSDSERLTDSIVAILREHGIPLRMVSGSRLLSSFAYPPLKTLKQLRSTIAQIWPGLSRAQSKMLDLDVAAIGLYVQVQSLLDINLEPS
jgi:hypothetical protein